MRAAILRSATDDPTPVENLIEASEGFCGRAYPGRWVDVTRRDSEIGGLYSRSTDTFEGSL